jgi:hypothetical protein
VAAAMQLKVDPDVTKLVAMAASIGAALHAAGLLLEQLAVDLEQLQHEVTLCGAAGCHLPALHGSAWCEVHTRSTSDRRQRRADGVDA